MNVLTIKSVDNLSAEMQNEVHHTFGMEHYTDYVFRAKGDQCYSATITMEDTSLVVENIQAHSVSFPDQEFIVDNLDMDNNITARYRIKNGKVLEKL